MIGTLVRGCICATLWCDLDITFDLVVLTMSLEIFSRLLNSLRCRRLTLDRDIG